MSRTTWYAAGGVTAVALLTSTFAIVQAQPRGVPADLSKNKIEIGVKGIVGQPVLALTPQQLAALQLAANRAPNVNTKDVGKGFIERPAEAVLVKAHTVAVSAHADKGFVNPKVPPGKVTWHKDFAAACAASARSGKPVLLFHMMGKLDDQFC